MAEAPSAQSSRNPCNYFVVICSVEKLSAGDAGRTTPRRKRWGMGGQIVGCEASPAAEDVGLARGRTRGQELFDRAVVICNRLPLFNRSIRCMNG